MARTEVTLPATNRTGTVQAIRQAGNIPAVLYGHGLPSQNVEVNAKLFAKAFSQAGYSSVIKLKLAEIVLTRFNSFTTVFAGTFAGTLPLLSSTLCRDFEQNVGHNGLNL